MKHQKLIPFVLGSLRLNQMVTAAALEGLASWLDEEGSTSIAEKLQASVSELRANAEIMDRAIAELLISDELKY